MKITYDDVIGYSGMITILSAYCLLTYKLIENLIVIDVLNIYGSLGVGYNSLIKKSYPTVLLESSWFIISIVSLVHHSL